MRRLEGIFPPGYEYRTELGLAGALWGTAAGVSAVGFAAKLYYAIDKLYQSVPMADGAYRRMLREGARVEAFAELMQWHWALWVPALVFLTALPWLHYSYYCRETRSIYVMRRLPQRGTVLRSCVLGPVLGIGIAIVTAAVLYALYYGIYCLGVPPECMPRYL